MTNKTIDEFFRGKPETYGIFLAIKELIEAEGPSEMTVASQISFGAKRKFAWIWLYNVTQKNPNGILHLMLSLNHKREDSHIRHITQISKNRWNHQIIIRTQEETKTPWLKTLIKQAYQSGNI